MKLKWFFSYPLPFLLFLVSCNLFEHHETIVTAPCGSTPEIIKKDSLEAVYGTVSLIDAEINGVPVQKWVIIPDIPTSVIYDACNLPTSVKKKWQRIYFRADVLENSAAVEDTIFQGMIPIQLRWLEIH